MFFEFGRKYLDDAFGALSSKFYDTWKSVRASPVLPLARYLETWTDGINWLGEAELTSHRASWKIRLESGLT
jgi:hypothetical protein